MRPEFFGGLIINRDNFEKWELTKFNTVYLIIFYNIKERKTSIDLTKQFFLDDIFKIDKYTLRFSKEYNYEIPEEYKIHNRENLLDYIKTQLKKIKSINYLNLPLELSLYLTSDCQLNCDYCFMHDLMKNNYYSMPIESVYNIIDKFDDKGIESISLLGGEPLLYKNKIDRYSLAIYVKDKNNDQSTINIKKYIEYYFQLQDFINHEKSNLDFALEGCMLYSAIHNDEKFKMSEFQKLNYGCQAAQTNLDIMFDGKAYACSLIRNDQCYVKNVFDKDYDSIWHNKIFNSFRNYEVSNELCNECNYNIFCNGGCFRNKLLKMVNFQKK